MIDKVHGHQLCVIHMLIISMLSKRGKIAECNWSCCHRPCAR